ncbi:MAG: sodium-dependent transporter [Bacteroidales bacterium]|nr:sodium-dependent transporter [Bacteroidales bacterium]
MSSKEQWATRVGLVLAMAGNAVGLGNFLRFPVQAVQNGGGAFLIPYFVSFLLLGIPLLWVEWSIGKYGGQYGKHTTPFMFHQMNKRWLWKYVGVFGIFTNIAIASYYAYIESWTISYMFHSIAGTFDNMSQHDVASFFTNYLDVSSATTGIPYESLVFFFICLSLNVWILSKGLSGGIEKASKIGVPLLIIFGIFLVIKALTLKEGEDGAINDGVVGLNFLWTPQFDSLANPKVWLAAAGQIFFTLSVGMGSIQCYASYLRKKDDVALNGMAAGWTNEFIEVIIGSSIIIPISIGYFGIDKVIELVQLGGLGLGFRSMPYLFEQWGPLLSAIAGFAFFGLLFFAGITSSLAMGQPVMAFLQDEFKWTRNKSALAFGIATLVLALPTIFFFEYGVFDEYDYWAGTVTLVVFAMLEVILFSWVFGINNGWKILTEGAEIKIPIIYKYILKYVTPIILIIVFLGALIRPEKDDWSTLFTSKYELHEESILGKIMNKGIAYNKEFFANTYYIEFDGTVTKVDKDMIEVCDTNGEIHTFCLDKNDKPLVTANVSLKAGDALYSGFVVNKIFWITASRLLLVILFLGIAFLVWKAYKKQKSNL